MPPFARKNTKKRKTRARKPEAPKACRFEKEKLFEIDYRDVGLLNRFVSPQGKLHGRKRNGISAFYQRQLNIAVKRARFLALLPFLGE